VTPEEVPGSVYAAARRVFDTAFIEANRFWLPGKSPRQIELETTLRGALAAALDGFEHRLRNSIADDIHADLLRLSSQPEHEDDWRSWRFPHGMGRAARIAREGSESVR
jgi:hypothetical protein